MVISDKLKKVIFKKLYKDLSHIEIIPYKSSIWFIDRENKYWYFEYGLNGTLFWRYPFFQSFFKLFSFEISDYEPIIIEWVEEVLNCKVLTTRTAQRPPSLWVEEVLNCKVLTTVVLNTRAATQVEEVLNCKVKETRGWEGDDLSLVEDVLKS